MKEKLLYTLQIADNALILGHRISEWCGHGPVLEQDIALTNTALDHLGQARSLYQFAATLFNAMDANEKTNLFTSTALQTLISAGKQVDEDDLAYLRDSWDFRNALLVEQPNNDWLTPLPARSSMIVLIFFSIQSCSAAKTKPLLRSLKNL